MEEIVISAGLVSTAIVSVGILSDFVSEIFSKNEKE